MPVMKRLTVDGVNYDTVGEASVTQTLTSGTKIATVTIDGTATDLYAPEGGGGGPEPSSTTPAMDGTAAVGTATTYARADHVHPTDTSLVPKSSTSNGQTTQITNDGSSVHLVSEKNSNYSDVQIGRNGNASVSLYASTTGSHTELIVAPTGVSIDKLVTPTTSTMPTTKQYVDDGLAAKQPTLVSGTSIKTVNSTSLLGSGDISVQPTLVSGTNIKTVGGTSLLGSGDIPITVPTASSTTPAMDGTAAVGTATTYARADHVHPTDTSRADASAIENATFSSGIISTWITPRATLLATLNSLNSGKQAKLVSGTNIKTINNESLLGSGNISTAELPTVTTSDNGKILQVVNGAWAATSLPSANGVSF